MISLVISVKLMSNRWTKPTQHTNYKYEKNPNMNQTTLLQYLEALDLSPTEAKIYLILNSKGPLTTLELARHTNIPRTSIYRFVQDLRQKGLAEKIIDQHRTKTQASHPDKLEFLIKQKQSQLEFLSGKFPSVIAALQQSQNNQDPTTKVAFYRGVNGIKQMAWNVLKAKTEVVGYTYRNLEEITGKKFMDSFREEFVSRDIKMRDLYSQAYLDSLATNQQDNESYNPEHFQGNYIPPEKLNIEIQADIYNDVFAIYNWHEGEVFGVEIYNQKVADFQRQIFEAFWNMA